MIKQLVFHIGDPKCGSSAIQTAMQDKACSPKKTKITSQRELNASALANVIAKNNKQRIKNQLLEKREWCESNQADIGLISAEFFERVTPKQFDTALKEYLPEYRQDVRAIAYVRPHSSRLLSGYAQRITTGTFTGDLNEFTQLMCTGALLQYYPRFLRWEKMLHERFILRPFIRSELKANDVVDDFFSQVLQGEEYELRPIKPANESLSVEELAGLKVIQEGLIQGGVPRHLRLPLGAAVARELGSKSKRFQNKLLLDRANAEKMYGRFREDAQALDLEFFKKPLMEVELAKSMDSSIKSCQSLEARDFLPEHNIKLLHLSAERLSTVPLEKLMSWRAEYQMRRGQLPVSMATRRSLSFRKTPEKEVWSIVGEIASLLLP